MKPVLTFIFKFFVAMFFVDLKTNEDDDNALSTDDLDDLPYKGDVVPYHHDHQ